MLCLILHLFYLDKAKSKKVKANCKKDKAKNKKHKANCKKDKAQWYCETGQCGDESFFEHALCNQQLCK